MLNSWGLCMYVGQVSCRGCGQCMLQVGTPRMLACRTPKEIIARLFIACCAALHSGRPPPGSSCTAQVDSPACPINKYGHELMPFEVLNQASMEPKAHANLFQRQNCAPQHSWPTIRAYLHAGNCTEHHQVCVDDDAGLCQEEDLATAGVVCAGYSSMRNHDKKTKRSSSICFVVKRRTCVTCVGKRR
jgi:hypothetical protein